jgi:hypothetical protein
MSSSAALHEVVSRCYPRRYLSISESKSAEGKRQIISSSLEILGLPSLEVMWYAGIPLDLINY